jgi:hypothetical protein
MDFTEILDDICSDDRITTGIPNLKDPNFCFVLQEYLVKNGISLEEVVDKTNMLFEKGRFPERQAYNKDGILVTFPTKEYRDRAVDKGTHSVENPKKQNVNIFNDLKKDSGLSISDINTKDDDSHADDDSYISIDDYINDNSEEDVRSDQEKQYDSTVVSNLLSTDNASVEEIKNFLEQFEFKKDGKTWKDDDGNIVAEQFFDESTKSLSINLNEKEIEKSKKVDISRMGHSQLIDIVTGTENYHLKTNVYETFPLLKSIGISADSIDNPDSLQKLSDVMRSTEYDFSSDARKWFNRIISIKKSKPSLSMESFKDMFNRFGGTEDTGDGVGDENVSKLLTDINGRVDCFIHSKIGQYRAVLKEKTNTEGDSKQNTADVVLVYGTTDVNDFINKLSNIKSEQDLISNDKGVISIKGTGISFCQVSLKADKGRIGKITKKYVSMVGGAKDILEEGNVLNEGLTSSLKNFISLVRSKISSLSEKSKKIYDYFIVRLTSFSENLLSSFRTIDMSNIRQKDEELESSLSEFINVFENSNTDIGTDTKDVSTDNQSTKDVKSPDEEEDSIQEYNLVELKGNEIPITDCLYVAFKKFYDKYKKYNFQGLINSFNTLADYKKIGGLVIKVDDLDVKGNQQIISEMEILNDIFEKAYSKLKSNPDVNEARKSCIETGDYITREQISPAIKFRANYVSLFSLHELFKKVIKNSSNLEVDNSFIPKVAAIFASEAIFGDNLTLPLYKFDGTKLIYFGTKQSYSDKKEQNFKQISDDGQIPISILNVYTVSTKDSHFIINLYLIHDFMIDGDVIEPEYIEITFSAGTGSSFGFNVESNRVVDYKTVKKKFLK